MREVRPGVWEDHPMGPPGLPSKPERNKDSEARSAGDFMNEARLCRALSKAFQAGGAGMLRKAAETSGETSREIKTTVGATLAASAACFMEAAAILEADELARLDMVGRQPEELQGGSDA